MCFITEIVQNKTKLSVMNQLTKFQTNICQIYSFLIKLSSYPQLHSVLTRLHLTLPLSNNPLNSSSFPTGSSKKSVIATTQLNSTQSWVGLIFLCKTKPQNHKPQTTNQNHNHPSLYLSSYTTKLDKIQYATLFQPN